MRTAMMPACPLCFEELPEDDMRHGDWTFKATGQRHHTPLTHLFDFVSRLVI